MIVLWAVVTILQFLTNFILEKVLAPFQESFPPHCSELTATCLIPNSTLKTDTSLSFLPHEPKEFLGILTDVSLSNSAT